MVSCYNQYYWQFYILQSLVCCLSWAIWNYWYAFPSVVNDASAVLVPCFDGGAIASGSLDAGGSDNAEMKGGSVA
ncbi:hypothetical protein U1Q18_017029 [Sarracenia purpurea var. burkii]